jgi:hypothetical protein
MRQISPQVYRTTCLGPRNYIGRPRLVEAFMHKSRTCFFVMERSNRKRANGKRTKPNQPKIYHFQKIFATHEMRFHPTRKSSETISPFHICVANQVNSMRYIFILVPSPRPTPWRPSLGPSNGRTSMNARESRDAGSAVVSVTC